jgi:hypothetical protein
MMEQAVAFVQWLGEGTHNARTVKHLVTRAKADGSGKPRGSGLQLMAPSPLPWSEEPSP